jgi:soluble lytic murein transglycosylase-like protein
VVTLLLAAVVLMAVGAGPAAAQPAAALKVPPAALEFRRTLIREIQFYWGIAQPVDVFFAQVHQESRWERTAKSPYAHGLAQFTPATAEWIHNLYPEDLRGYCAQGLKGCPYDPRWALRAMVIYDKRLWALFPWTDGDDRWGWTLAAYNGGAGWLPREQARCREAKGRDCDRWFGGVEQHCLRAKWACAENRAYPSTILFRWRAAYAAWLP